MAIKETISKNGSNGYHAFTLTVTEDSTSTTNNTSTVSWSFKISPVKTGYNWDYSNTVPVTYKVTIGGKTYNGNIMKYNGSSTVTIDSGTRTIEHKSNGTKEITIAFEVTSINKDYLPGSASNSTTMTLSDIPRPSTITSASDAYAGDNCSISWTPQSSKFKFKLTFSGAHSGSTGWIEPGSTKNYTYTGYQFPSSASAGSVTAKLTTYTSAGVELGSDSESFTLTKQSTPVVISPPTVGTITLSPQTYGLLIQGKNKLKINVSGCTCDSKTSIQSYTFSGSGIATTIVKSTSTTASITVGPISNMGTLTYTVKVTDATGQSSEPKSATIYCYPYFNPYFDNVNFKAYRVNEENSTESKANGNYIYVEYTFSYAKVDGNNAATTTILGYDGTILSSSELSSTTNGNIVTKKQAVWINVGNNTKTYKISATLSDKYTSNIISPLVTVPGAKRILNIKSNGKGMAIGKMAESDKDNLLDIAWQTRFEGGILHPILADGTNIDELFTPNVYVGENLDKKPYNGTFPTSFTSGTFTLEVMGAGPDGQILQRLTECKTADARTWERICYANHKWGEWVCVSDYSGRLLWSGGWYMTSGHIATLSEPVSKQKNGIVLVFSAYSGGAAQDYNWSLFFIPKYYTANNLDRASGTNFIMSSSKFGTIATKYLYINDTEIKGNDDNSLSGTAASGIKYSNQSYVLRYVIGV